MRRALTATLLAVAALAIWPVVSEAVIVAPHAVFMNHRTRAATLTLANPGQGPEEVEIELRYGYATTDSLGQPSIALFDTIPDGAPAATPWIRAFPRRLRLEPGQRQVVRLVATPPGDLADGEYWSRILVTSRAVAEGAAAADSGMRAGVSLQVRTILSLNYRKGDVQTALRLRDLRSAVEGDTLVSWLELGRAGNAAFLGSVRYSVRDSMDVILAEWTTPVAVYREWRRRFAFPLDSVPVGRYRVNVDLSTDRDDIDQDVVLPATSVSRSFGIEVRR